MVRKRRWARTEDEEIRSLSSLFALTVRAYKYLRKKGVSGAEKLLKPMFKWMHRHDERMPRPEELDPGETRTDRDTAIKRIKDLIETMGRRSLILKEPKEVNI